MRYAGYTLLLLSAFFICFGRFVCLEVAATETRFVKHIYHFNPNRPLELVQILCIVEHIVCLIIEDVAGYVKRIRQARCRQANERWTGSDGNNLKITGKRSNDRLGLTIHRLALSHKKAHPMPPSKGGWGGTRINFKTVFITLLGDINYTSRPY